jgi:hypothetical protein
MEATVEEWIILGPRLRRRLIAGMGKNIWVFRSESLKSAALLFATFLLLSLATATAAAKSSSIGI